MEQIRFYLDEHIHSAVADGLRRRGIEALTVQQARKTGLSDREQLAFALITKRVMVTMDSDFLAIVSEGVSHAGVAYASPGKSIGELIRAIVLIHDVLTSTDMKNHVEYL